MQYVTLFFFYIFHFLLIRNRFKSFDVCIGFCEAAKSQSSSSSLDRETDKSTPSFVTEPPLGPRPDLLEPLEEIEEEYEEYDEARCQVSNMSAAKNL